GAETGGGGGAATGSGGGGGGAGGSGASAITVRASSVGGPARAVTPALICSQPGWLGWPSQLEIEATCAASNGMGGGRSSAEAWTSFLRPRATLASARTHSDATAASDQTTTTALARPICSAIVSADSAVGDGASSRQTS